MKNKLINKTISAVLGIVVLSSLMPAALATGTAQFNTAGGDWPVLQTSNYTKYPGSNSNWARTVSVDPGDVSSFLIFYHNTSNATALNTRVKLNLPSVISSGNTITASISADNASTASGSINIYLNYGSNLSLALVSGSARWYTGSSSNLTTIPFGQNGDEVATFSNGLRIGDIAAGNSGYLVVRAQLGGYNQLDSALQGNVPSAFTNSSSNISTTSATLQGSVNPNNSGTTAWFEYGPTQSVGFTTTTFSIGGGSSQTSYSAGVYNLAPNTTYYFRAVAQNAYGISRGSILSFTTTAEQQQQQGGAPFARTDATSGVSTTSVTLLGAINPNGASTEGWFEYGTTQSLGSTTSRQSIGSGNSYANFTASLTSLFSNTTYYFRAVAQNNLGTSQGSILSFTTQNEQASGGAPLVNTSSASNISTTSATFYGSVNSNNSNTTAWFEYGQTQSMGLVTSTFSIGSGNSYNSFSASAFNLSSNVTYYYRAVAQNNFGTSYGSMLSFITQNQQTSGGAPLVNTSSSSSISTTSATLYGSVNPNNSSTTAWFEYGQTQSFGYTTSSSFIGSGNSYNSFSSSIFNLSSNSTYYFRAVAQNNYGTSYGNILSFSTGSQNISGNTPLVTTNSASVISTTSATLYGSANPNNSFATGWFEYGTTSSLGNTTSSFSLGSGNSYQSYSATIFNLASNSSYYYRAVAQNGYGTAYGALLSFTTGTGQVTTGQDLSGIAYSLAQLTSALGRLNALVGNLSTNRVTERIVEVASTAGSDLAKLTFTADKESLDPGDKVVFTVQIEPLANLTNAVLAVKLDPGLQFESTNANSYSKSENTFTYNLGSIPAGNIQTFKINVHLDSNFERANAENGVITSTATFSYADADGNVKTPLFSSLDIKIGGAGFFASLLGLIPGGGWVAILLVAFLVLLIAIAVRKLFS